MANSQQIWDVGAQGWRLTDKELRKGLSSRGCKEGEDPVLGRLALRNGNPAEELGMWQNAGFQAGHGSKVGLTGLTPVDI